MILFISLCLLQDPLFEDWTDRAGLRGVKSRRVAFADLNGDGYPDAIIKSTRILMNKNGERLHDTGFEAPPRVSLVQVGDVNNDGTPDLFLGRSTDLSNEKFKDDGLRHEIWIGNGKGGFSRQNKSGVGKYAETIISALFVDFDRDGNLDLFTGSSYTAYGKSLEAFPDRLYRGRGDGTFEEVTGKAGLLGSAQPGSRESRKPTYGVAHTDWNNDGLQDLLVMTYGRQWNRLWKNNGDGTFTDVAGKTGFDGDSDRTGTYPPIVKRRPEMPFRSNGNTFDCAVADFDGDGDMDCFLGEITHWWAGSSSDRSMLLINKEGRFTRDPGRIPRKPATPRWNQGDLHAGWLDVDNDGRLDLLIASTDYPDDQVLRLFHQIPGGKFEDWTDRLGFRWRNASQISLGDFDQDGATDILVGTSNMRLTKEQRQGRDLSVGLYRNRMASGNAFVSIRLGGQAIGARVSIWTGKQRQTREIYGGLGHAGHRDQNTCRFGLGKAKIIDRIEVRWPDRDGTIQIFNEIAPNRFYRLEKGGKLIP